MGATESAQTLTPHLCSRMAKPTATIAGPTPAKGAPIIHSDVLLALSLQSCLQHVYSWITQLLGHSGFSPASKVVQSLGTGSDFSFASACGQPTSPCVLPELVEAELCPLWAFCEWGYCGGSPQPLPSSAHVNNGVSVVDLGSFLCTPLIVSWTTLQALQVVSLQPTPVLSLGLSSEDQVSAPSLLHTPVDLCLGLGSVGKWPLCCSLCSDCCKLAALLSSEPLKLPFCPIWSPHWWRGFPGWGNFSSFTAPFQGCRPHPDSFLFLLSYWLCGDHSCHFGFMRSLPAFSSYSVKIVPRVDVFFMYLWEEVSSTSFSSAILIWLQFSLSLE